MNVWGAAPRPGREKFSLHPRHVRWTCLKDVAVESNGYAFTHSGLPVALAARSVAVEGLSLRACTLRFLFSVLRGAKRPFPAPPARLRRANKHDGMTSTPQQEIQECPASGRRMKTLEDRQGAKRRAAGAVSGGAAERPTEPEAVHAPSCVFAVKPLRSLGGYAAPPTYPQFQQSYKQRLIKLSAIGTVINAFYRIIDKVINSG